MRRAPPRTNRVQLDPHAIGRRANIGTLSHRNFASFLLPAESAPDDGKRR